MKRLVGSSARRRAGASRGRGYTLVELLTATVLTLMLMFGVVTVFGSLGRSINSSRATLEMTGRLRTAKAILQSDLKGLTVLVSPPRQPREDEGYLEIVEGGIGPVIPPFQFAVNSDTALPDTTVGDCDDILMFTTRSRSGPFVGRYGTSTVHSNEAEVAWFVRGRTLYRRVLLVAPQVMPALDDDDDGVIDADDLEDSDGDVHSFYEWYDLSARPDFAITGSDVGWILNTLGDLTKRENRFAHRVHLTADAYPFDVRRWGQLGLPTLRECSDPTWMGWATLADVPTVTAVSLIDLWNNPHPWVADTSVTPPTSGVDRDTGTLLTHIAGPRIAEDVILTNVVGFDVKVWDPGAPVFYGVWDRGTTATYPDDLDDDRHVTGVRVTQGDAGYPLALAHFWQELAEPDETLRDLYYLPVGSRRPPGSSTGGTLTGARWGAYVDMYYYAYAAAPTTFGVTANWSSTFSGPGQTVKSGLTRIYDTWSYHYEHDGVDQFGDGVVDIATDGFDNNSPGTTGYGIVDDPSELETNPPYPVPLRGIQIKIRTFEPDSRQVREVTVITDFAPK